MTYAKRHDERKVLGEIRCFGKSLLNDLNDDFQAEKRTRLRAEPPDLTHILKRQSRWKEKWKNRLFSLNWGSAMFNSQGPRELSTTKTS